MHTGLVHQWSAVENAAMPSRGGSSAASIRVAERGASDDSGVGASAPLGAVARLWWLMVRRRWQHESGVVLAAAAFVGFLVLLRGAHAHAGAGSLTALLALALGNATVLTLSVGGLSISAMRRLHLVPMDQRTAFRMRLLFGSPLRLVLFAATLVWVIVHLIALHLSATRLAIETGQAILIVAATALASTLLDHSAEDDRGRAAQALRSLVVWTVGALTVLAAIGGWQIDALPPRAAAALTWATPLLVGSSEAWSREAAALILWGILVGVLFAAGERSAQRAHSRAYRQRRSMDRAGIVPDALPVRLRTPLLLLVRMRSVRREMMLSTGVALLAFSVGLPWLLFALPAVWFGFLVNALGPDVPLGGLTRFRLVGHDARRALLWRHAAVLIVVTTCVAVAGVVAAWIGIALPLSGGAGRSRYLATFLFSAAIVLLTAVATTGVALRYPLPRARNASAFERQPTGPAALMLWVLLAMGMVVGGAVGVFAVSGVLAALLARSVPLAATPDGTLVIAATVTVALCAVVQRLSRRAYE
jgi:hypothetical protein